MPLGRRTVGLLGMLLGLVLAASAFAKPGMVTTLDNATYDGDVDEASRPGEVQITQKTGAKITIKRANIRAITFFDNPRQEFDAKMARLTPKDAAGRVAVAQWAMDIKQYDLAREALASATQVDPKNKQADALLQKLNQEAPATAPPTAQPAGEPAVKTTGKGVRFPVVKRPVTPEEINQIRQIEWRADDRTVKFRVPPDVRTKFIQSGIMPPADAIKLNPSQLAQAILQQGPPAMHKDVQILNDPQPMQFFRLHVQKTISMGCASCHAPDKAALAGNFVLFPGDTEPATYSNFLILQRVTKTVEGVEYSLVDRSRPEASLLLIYLLPPEQANPPGTGHPAGAYKGTLKNALEPRYKDMLQWAQSLSPLPPNYDSIDLSKGDAKPEPKPAAPPK